MGAVRSAARRLASSSKGILIRGEIGTGKETLARYIHRLSPWREGPFVRVNASDAVKEMDSVQLELPDRGTRCWGTIFVDEISEAPKDVQERLIKMLRARQGQPESGDASSWNGLRLICTSNRSLPYEVAAKRFSPELYYWISAVSIELPPLRERREDIVPLSLFFLSVFREVHPGHGAPLSPELTQRLEQHEWPGNIRELANLMLRYNIMESEQVVVRGLQESPDWLRKTRRVQEPVALKSVTRQAVHDLERKIILQALENHNWNRKQAAEALHISYRALLYKIKEAGWALETKEAAS